MVVVGGWMLLEHIAVIRIDIRDVWPLFLVFLGGYLMFKGFGGGPRTSTADSTAHITALAPMARAARRRSPAALRGGEPPALIGGSDIRLRGPSRPRAAA